MTGTGIRVLLVAALLASPLAALAAGDWQPLSDEFMAPALTARSMALPDGRSWGFFADGRVLEGEVWGRWQAGDETLCLIWPGNEPRCYRLELKGIDLRFSPVDGSAPLVARYNDL